MALLVILFFLHPIIFLFILMFLETPCRKQIRYKNYLFISEKWQGVGEKMKVKGRRALGVCEEPQVQNLDSQGDL